MSDLPSLLPPSVVGVERDFEQVTARLVGLSFPVGSLWDPALCPEYLLPYLAWSFSVDDWDPGWSEETKRSAVAASVSIHRRKGTIGAVVGAIAAFGYGSAAVVEGFEAIRHDGTRAYDGLETYAAPDHWAEYRVYLERPITIDQAGQLKSILKNVAPARCRLKGLYFTEAAHRFNAAILHDGSFTHGAVQ